MWPSTATLIQKLDTTSASRVCRVTPGAPWRHMASGSCDGVRRSVKPTRVVLDDGVCRCRAYVSSRRFSRQRRRLCLPGRARLPRQGPELCPAAACLSRRWQGARPHPAGPTGWTWTAAWTRPCWTAPVLAFRTDCRGAGSPEPAQGGGCHLGTLGSGSLCPQQAFAGQMKQDLFLEDSKRWGL